MERSLSADGRSQYEFRLGRFAGAATLAAVRPVFIGSVSVAGVAALVTATGGLFTGCSGFPLRFGQHGAGLLAGAGVDEVVA